jgi:titin
MGEYGERYNLPTTPKTRTWYRKVSKFFGQLYPSSATKVGPRASYRPLVELLEDRLAPATTFTVNSLADTNTGDATTNMGTLRWVINQANADMTGTAVSADTINFSVAGTINVGNTGLGALPALTDIAIIYGTSAPGYGGIPVVILVGTSAGANANGLTLLNAAAVSGLDIINFTGNGVELDSVGLIVANWIGVTTAGNVEANAKDGILINDASGNTIGGTISGYGNVISGNTGSGVDITGPTASGNLLEGNSIGTNAAGSTALGNIKDGVRIINGAHDNQIGGVGAGAGNLISGNGFGGVSANGVGIYNTGSSGNLIEGNTIGADHAGSKDIDTAYADVFIGYGAASNTVGGAVAGAGNLLTSAFQAGVFIFGNNKTGTSGNLVEGNTIGLLAGGTAKSFNPFGVELTNGASNNTIGGTTAGAGNLIAASTLDGIEIDTAGTSGNLVEGNTVGTNATSSTATFLQNGWAGIFVGYGATNNTIGGSTTGAGNVLSNNFETGLELFEIDSTGNVVQGNDIGTNAAGMTAVANGVNGIFLLDTSQNTIGGTIAAAGNLISGNKVDGIDLISFSNSVPCMSNVIEDNEIGTQVNGTAALANDWAGIFVGYGAAINNTIGSSVLGEGNVISGNAAIGLELFGGGTTGNLVEDNLIGTNVFKSAKLGNFYGILISGAIGNTIGGTTAAAGNIISGNGGDGVLFESAASGNLVAGNIIGSNTFTSGSGLNLGNGGIGVELQSGTGPNTVGGSAADANRIVFNTGQAILDNGTGDNTSHNIFS